jgi:ribosomal protein S12 methylthiotransferase accessory factor
MRLITYKNQLVNKKTGIIQSLDSFKSMTGTIPMYLSFAVRNSVVDEDLVEVIPPSHGSGFDFFSKELAEIKAIGEAVERYSSMFYSPHFIESPYNGEQDMLNPYIITRYTDAQYKNIYCTKVTDETLYYWVEGVNELNGKKIWIPTDLVYLKPFIKNKYPIREVISTGLAAGSSIETAKINGTLECIERDAIVIMWLNRLSMPIISKSSIKDPEINKIISIIEELNLEVVILDITNDLQIATYFAIILNRSNKLPYLSIGAGSHFSPISALKSALTEAAAAFNIHAKKIINKSLKSIERISDIKTMEDHLTFYALNKCDEAINFLFEGSTIDFNVSSRKYIKNFEELKGHLQHLEIDLLTVDLTTEDIKQAGMSVVRTIMPQLAFLEMSVPMLRCERIYEVPKKMGFAPPKKLNPFPHPFP